MNLVDSCGWLEYFADGPNADFFAPPIENTSKLIVPAICLAEVFKRVLQQSGEDKAIQVMAAMHQGKIVELDSSIAISAAKLGTDLNLPLADSVILATARATNSTIWTQDADFENLPGVKYIKKR
ncbi:MAG: type II toxin-antitoxin system VapC family toxin [Nitrospinota bacterium]|nr:type II toxin-antitoxin system VapC family toxin [Nitrospinota bacterium]